MTEDVEFAMHSLIEALEDGDPAWIKDAAEEVELALNEQRDELMWSIKRLLNARDDGDSDWIADAVEELDANLLTHGIYAEICTTPAHEDAEEAPTKHHSRWR